MKKIVFVRHAKSDRSVSGLRDIDRPLNERGYADAHKMGAYIRDKITGDIILVSSPAIRAISTALIFAHEIKYSPENILMHADLYEAEVSVYKDLIISLKEMYDTVFIFGHNPTISQVVAHLLKKYLDDMPTCSMVALNYHAERWSQTKDMIPTLEMQLFPKLLIN